MKNGKAELMKSFDVSLGYMCILMHFYQLLKPALPNQCVVSLLCTLYTKTLGPSTVYFVLSNYFESLMRLNSTLFSTNKEV